MIPINLSQGVSVAGWTSVLCLAVVIAAYFWLLLVMLGLGFPITGHPWIRFPGYWSRFNSRSG
jgi:hypothetical protein